MHSDKQLPSYCHSTGRYIEAGSPTWTHGTHAYHFMRPCRNLRTSCFLSSSFHKALQKFKNKLLLQLQSQKTCCINIDSTNLTNWMMSCYPRLNKKCMKSVLPSHALSLAPLLNKDWCALARNITVIPFNEMSSNLQTSVDDIIANVGDSPTQATNMGVNLGDYWCAKP